AGNTPIATNLCAGIYIVTVTDFNGCSTTQNIMVNEPSQLTAIVSTFPSTCGNANGVAIVNVSGGTSPYTLPWDTAFGLLAGSYDVTITDANSCTYTLPITVLDLPGATIDSISTTDVTCNGICDGTATASVSGGTSPLTYSWNTTPVQTTLTATGLCAGTHTITVTDLNGCVAIDTVIINEPDILEVITSGDTTICNGDSAQISVAISGATPPFVRSWNNGLSDNSSHIVSPVVTTTYTVTVTDANSCTASASVTVTIYPPLSSSVIAIEDTICAGASTTLTASASGGNGGPYTYTWLNDGSMGSTITVSPATDSTFTIVVSDGGCSINDTTSAIVVVEICSGISEFEVQSLMFQVYPNPSRGVFLLTIYDLRIANVRIAVYDILGRMAWSTGSRNLVPINIGSNNEIEIDMSNHPAGIYHLQLVTGEGISNKKIIIELKIVPEIFPLHKAQIISYLKVTGLPLGLLINFGGSRLFIKGYPNNVSNNKVLNIPFDIDKVNLSNNKKELIEPFLSISKEILETLGPGYFHQVYRRAFWYELKDQDIDFEIIKQLELIYKGKTYASKEVRFYKVNDLLISIVSVNKLDDRILYNLSKYKRYYNCKNGLIINFNSTVIDFRLL
ncbi:MAG: GxxExxY protein, partial [Bacteroidetes bacterium]|nr:GxxExxY protein [Bacteroidota bacterium]